MKNQGSPKTISGIRKKIGGDLPGDKKNGRDKGTRKESRRRKKGARWRRKKGKDHCRGKKTEGTPKFQNPLKKKKAHGLVCTEKRIDKKKNIEEKNIQ